MLTLSEFLTLDAQKKHKECMAICITACPTILLTNVCSILVTSFKPVLSHTGNRRHWSISECTLWIIGLVMQLTKRTRRNLQIGNKHRTHYYCKHMGVSTPSPLQLSMHGLRVRQNCPSTCSLKEALKVHCCQLPYMHGRGIYRSCELGEVQLEQKTGSEQQLYNDIFQKMQKCLETFN